MIPLIIQDQFYTIGNLQRSPIPQTSNWSGTFFAVSYSKPALGDKLSGYVIYNSINLTKKIIKKSIQIVFKASVSILLIDHLNLKM